MSKRDPVGAQGEPSPRRRLGAGQRRELIERSAASVFAERGYHGASIEEIARRSGVTPPVIYDHFDSKVALLLRLLERTREELLGVWAEYFPGKGPAAERIGAAIAAWAAYVREHPFAARLYFNESTGVAEIRRRHAEIQAEARAALAGLVAGEAAGEADGVTMELAAEVIRSGLAGLAIWWQEHPEVPVGAIVESAMNVVWLGFERFRDGERWTATSPEA